MIVTAGMIGAPTSRLRCSPTPSVGVARVDITPDYPIRLTGFAVRKTESEGVAQRIAAVAVGAGALAALLPFSMAPAAAALMIPGIVAVTPFTYFGGNYGTETVTSFPQFAVDPSQFMQLIIEGKIVEGSLEAWVKDRNSCLVGADTIKRYGLKLAGSKPFKLSADPRERDLHEVQKELGMVEGFDICFEMSGSAVALRSAIASMAHGGRIAQLGIPTGDVSLDLNEIVFKMLTLRGIYGREMYETWYKMTVMLQSGLDIRPVITHRFSFREHEAAFAAARSGDSGKVIMDWTS